MSDFINNPDPLLTDLQDLFHQLAKVGRERNLSGKEIQANYFHLCLMALVPTMGKAPSVEHRHGFLNDSMDGIMWAMNAIIDSFGTDLEFDAAVKQYMERNAKETVQ